MKSKKILNKIYPYLTLITLLPVLFLFIAVLVSQKVDVDEQKLITFTLIIVIIISLLNFYITLHKSQSLSSLVKITKNISELDFTTLKSIEGSPEMSDISVNLQKMSKKLEQRFNSAIRQKKELKAIFSALVESIIVTDEKLFIKNINQAAINLFKITDDLYHDNSLIHLTHNSELNEIAEKTIIEKCPQYKTIIVKEQFVATSDQFFSQKFTSRDLFLQVNTSLIETENHSTRIILVLHDITHLKTLERIRKDFVANVSHELKTPITSILGFVETLQDGAMNNKKDSIEFLNIIHSQAQRLDLIIQDLLSLSILESFENTQIEMEEYNLSDIISSSLKVCQERIVNRKMDIRTSLSNNLKVRVNSRLMEQAIINLIDNAIKYCPEESCISIKGEKYFGYTIIRVSDNGSGIPDADIPRVFERFYTVNKARSRELGGTGLGLSIVKHIVLTHRGEISIRNLSPKGVEFIIRIPS